MYTVMFLVFQFHYGSVKSVFFIPVEKGNAYFNSTMVRLKASRVQRNLISYFHFNSTMVRLKVV